jgi:hypothetical protein
MSAWILAVESAIFCAVLAWHLPDPRLVQRNACPLPAQSNLVLLTFCIATYLMHRYSFLILFCYLPS